MTKDIVTRNGDVWQAAREVSCVDVAKRCGLELKRHGQQWRTVCPFHAGAENGTSFIVSERGFRCWACGEYGDGIALYAGLQNVSPLDAARALAGNGPYPGQDMEIMRKRQAAKAFREWERGRFIFLVRLKQTIEARAAADGLEVTELWLSGIHVLPRLEYDIETLTTGSDAEKLALWRVEHGRN